MPFPKGEIASIDELQRVDRCPAGAKFDRDFRCFLSRNPERASANQLFANGDACTVQSRNKARPAAGVFDDHNLSKPAVRAGKGHPTGSRSDNLGSCSRRE